MDGGEAKQSSFAGSLAVPCVQELAKQPLTKIPERSLRDDLDLQVGDSDTVSSSQEIPVIDMNKLLSAEPHESELHKLDSACRQWGFFQLINHGVKASMVEDVKRGVKEFFNLPMEEKKKLWQKTGETEGFGQLFVVSEEQKLEWADLFMLITLPSEARSPHIFPNLPLPFRDNIEAYGVELKKLAIKIIDLMGEALKMEPNEIRELFEGGRQRMRMNYYPPCPEAEKVIGLSPHSDRTGLTILLQTNEVGGLQIKKDGKWISVNPLLHAFVINVGDILEIMSNGIYRSIEHRATVNSKKERISIATFYSPKVDGYIGPAPSLVTPQNPPLFKSIVVSDFFKHYRSRKLDGKSHLDFIRIHNHNGESTWQKTLHFEPF